MRRRSTDKITLKTALTIVVLGGTCIGFLWAAATPYIDARIDEKLEPVHDALLYQNSIMMVTLDSLHLQKAEEMYRALKRSSGMHK